MAQFEWDERKRLSVLETRGVDFIDAVGIFDGELLIQKDRRRRYGEERSIAVGETEGHYFVVVYTTREDVFRIITAWRAGRRARRRYQEIYGRRVAGDATGGSRQDQTGRRRDRVGR